MSLTVIPKRYSVKSIFRTIQGEGMWAGTPAVFCRFAGCNLDCSFCDTNFKGGTSYSLDDLELAILGKQLAEPLLVFTGGEPALQLDAELVGRMRNHFKVVAIETNGTRYIGNLGLDHVCMSPKPSEPGSEIFQRSCTELKYVLKAGDPLPEVPYGVTYLRKYLSPMTDPSKEGPDAFIKENLDWCVKLAMSDPRGGWNISLQTHKLLGVE
jgi:7-carboxy-7-deazaguanine synthase